MNNHLKHKLKSRDADLKQHLQWWGLRHLYGVTGLNLNHRALWEMMPKETSLGRLQSLGSRGSAVDGGDSVQPVASSAAHDKMRCVFCALGTNWPESGGRRKSEKSLGHISLKGWSQ